MYICLVEDQGYRNLFPLTKTRPSFGLRCGRFTIEERITKILSPYADRFYYLMRPELWPVWKDRCGENKPCSFGIPQEGNRLILNGRALMDERALNKILTFADNGESVIWLAEDTWAAVYLPAGEESFEGDVLTDNRLHVSSFKKQHYLNAPIITYTWDLTQHNAEMIQADFSYLDRRRMRLRYPPLPRFTAVIDNKKLLIGQNTEIQPFVTLDARNGPIIIGDNTTIESGTYVKGPVSIGDNCLISANTKMYDNTTIGDVCKAGGEISHTIIHAFSNKRHDGFLGNAYLGEWINMGAGTTNSNLKNNYNTIQVQVDGETIDTGSQFVGLYMGDHCRTGIGTVFNTATFVGVGCNIFGEGFPPRYIEDFTWNGISEKEMYDFDKFATSVHRMMIRREAEPSREEMQLLKSLHDSANVMRLSTYRSQPEETINGHPDDVATGSE